VTTQLSFRNYKTRIWIGCFLGICLFIALGMVLMPRNPTVYPEYVTESPSPSGVKAFYTLLEKDFAPVETWNKPAQALPLLNSRQLMIMVEPSAPLNSNEIEQWTKWLEAGNQLWLLDRNPKGLFHLQTSLINQELSQETNPVATVWGSEEWEGTYHASLEPEARLVAESKDHVLLKDQHGVLALSRTYGQGELMVLLAPEWLTNGMILQQDHLQLLLPFILRANPQVIWFNDFVHRNKNLPTVLGVYPEWFLVFLTQLTLSFLLWLLYKGKRFGSVQTPREWVVRLGDERLRAIAAWYERGKFYKESLAIQDEFLRHTVQERWGIPLDMEGAEFIEAALQRIPPDRQQQWLQNWRGLKEAYAEKISPQAYLKWSKLLDDMQKEVEHR
jgi:hypothetical protein